ncbi:hypothetical protein V5O48_012095 [Marasmius crinis-equi]|uniref:Uncharacterized protein n=1 Tax=Marasmius crinis-equi TaxID=585013 RepID=A0ABR3F3S7_9AGAR
MRQSGLATEQRLESSGIRMRTETGSSFTRPHRVDQTAPSASTASRRTIPKSSNLDVGARTVSIIRPPTRHLASTGGTKMGGRGAAMTIVSSASSSRAAASRPRPGRFLPSQEGVLEPILESSSAEEHTQTPAQASKESPSAPPPLVTNTSRRNPNTTRPPPRWR